MDWLQEAIKLEATPKSMRAETIRDFCARFNIPESNYYYHLSKSENKAQILEITLNEAKTRAPEILKKLGDLAESGDIRAIDIYLDYILQLAKNLDIKTGGRPIIQIAKEIIEKNGLNAQSESNS
jgi:hypothetical protein